MNGISVIVCCYNSANRLPKTIQHLLCQHIKDFCYEIIIVDNASLDNTATIAHNLLSKQTWVKYKIIKQPIPGLSNARKMGNEQAEFDIILYCDDDNWLDTFYLQTAYDILHKDNSIMILGGRGEPIFEGIKPKWFDKYQINFACGEINVSKNDGTLIVNEVYGAGIVMRKPFFTALSILQFTSVLTDRMGNEVISGGDTEYCFIAKMMGYKIAYSPLLRFKHYMPEKRMSFSYLKKLYKGFGKSRLYLQIYEYVMNHKELPNKNLKFPFWKDKLIHKKREMISFYPQIWFLRETTKNHETILKFEALKGELEEIEKLKDNYLSIFKNVLDLKSRIARL